PPWSLRRVMSLASWGLRAGPARFEFLEERLTVRRLPVLEKHLLQLQAVDDRVIAVVVVQRQVDTLRLAVQRARGSGDLLELLLAVQVVVLLGNGGLLAL